MRKASVFWFTGLSGSGKTTIVDEIIRILQKEDKRISIFDGDVVRQNISKHLGFTPDDIRENNRIIAGMCVECRNDFDYIFVPIISPFVDSRYQARQQIGASFHLIYCKSSLEEVIRRDTKGLYKMALTGEKDNFIGIDPDVPYQPPDDADLVLDTEREDIETSVKKLVDFIKQLDKEYLCC